jgi:uncharacterized protein YggU (UPF0235/DUF167 family)
MAKPTANSSDFLAEAFDCPKGQITLLRGTSSRQKSLELPAEVMDRLPK